MWSSRRLRTTLALAAILAVVAGCGDDAEEPPTTALSETTLRSPNRSALPPEPTPTSTTVSTATATRAPTPTGATQTTAVASEAAPDFALELGTGGTFVLSEEARPVFIVFWAEW